MAWLDSLEQVQEFGCDLGKTDLRDRAKLRIDRHRARCSLWLNYVDVAILLADLISSDIFLVDWNSAFSFLFVHLLGNFTRLLIIEGSRACDFQIADRDQLLKVILVGKHGLNRAALLTERANLRMAIAPIYLTPQHLARSLGQAWAARHIRQRRHHSRRFNDLFSWLLRCTSQHNKHTITILVALCTVIRAYLIVVIVMICSTLFTLLLLQW